MHNFTQASKSGSYYSMKLFDEVKGNLKTKQKKNTKQNKNEKP